MLETELLVRKAESLPKDPYEEALHYIADKPNVVWLDESVVFD